MLWVFGFAQKVLHNHNIVGVLSWVDSIYPHVFDFLGKANMNVKILSDSYSLLLLHTNR
jgi:hypothetical protein